MESGSGRTLSEEVGMNDKLRRARGQNVGSGHGVDDISRSLIRSIGPQSDNPGHNGLCE